MRESKSQDTKSWSIVTIGVAVIGCIGVIGAALINVLPEMIKANSSIPQTSVIISTATSSYPTPFPTISSLAFTTSINTYVKDLKFFEGGSSSPPQRIYSTRFTGETARYIYWELNLGFPQPPGQQIDFIIHTVYYRPDGNIFGEDDSNWNVRSDTISAILSAGTGWNDGGHWEKGTYTVILYVNKIEIARASFIIE